MSSNLVVSIAGVHASIQSEIAPAPRLKFFLKCVISDYELNFNNTMTKTDR